MNRRTAPPQLAAPENPAPLPALRRTAVRRTALLAAGLLAAAALAGCSSKADATASTGGGKTSCNGTHTDAGLKISLTATPCPLEGGKTGTAAITVTDSSGKAVDGATVEVNPEMPSMKMKGGNQTATAKGDGYQAKLVLGMPGDWKVTVHVSPAGGEAAAATFTLTAK